MIYRTVGQFKTSYAKDQALFPVKQDAFLLGVILIFAWVIFPLTRRSLRSRRCSSPS